MARAAARFITIWEFGVRPGRRAQFLRAYGPEGSWAKLFRKSQGYLGTELCRTGSNHYITIDRWCSAGDHRSFLRREKDAYRRLDAACELLTSSERFLGSGRAITARKP